MIGHFLGIAMDLRSGLQLGARSLRILAPQPQDLHPLMTKGLVGMTKGQVGMNKVMRLSPPQQAQPAVLHPIRMCFQKRKSPYVSPVWASLGSLFLDHSVTWFGSLGGHPWTCYANVDRVRSENRTPSPWGQNRTSSRYAKEGQDIFVEIDSDS